MSRRCTGTRWRRGSDPRTVDADGLRAALRRRCSSAVPVGPASSIAPRLMRGTGMGPLRAWAGVWRSVRVYHLDRHHLRALGAMARGLVPPGGLVFDIGAHVGDRTRVFAALGARVVAVEPQPRLARWLRLAFRFSRRVSVVEAAVGAREGRLALRINSANPTVSTGSEALVGAAAAHPNWSGQRWDDTVDVAVTTLDALIAAHGAPDFVKIDVEGLEDAVLAGLSRPVPALSFEFTTVQRDVGLAALDRAAALGYRAFNLSLGETQAFAFAAPVDHAALRAAIEGCPDEANSGDVYCWPGPPDAAAPTT